MSALCAVRSCHAEARRSLLEKVCESALLCWAFGKMLCCGVEKLPWSWAKCEGSKKDNIYYGQPLRIYHGWNRPRGVSWTARKMSSKMLTVINLTRTRHGLLWVSTELQYYIIITISCIALQCYTGITMSRIALQWYTGITLSRIALQCYIGITISRIALSCSIAAQYRYVCMQYR